MPYEGCFPFMLLTYAPKYEIHVKLLADAVDSEILSVQAHLGKQVQLVSLKKEKKQGAYLGW